MEPSNLIFNEILIRSKLKDLNSPNRLTMGEEPFVNSAVAFLIIPYTDRPYDLVLIRRTKRKTDKHAGEMSFPGGKFDLELDKTCIDTAIRETEEELGIPRKNIKIIGSFDDGITPRRFIITPFIGYIVHEYQKFKKQDEEVEEIVKIPISFFVDINNFKEIRQKKYGQTFKVASYHYNANNQNYVIFGATTYMIIHFIKRVYNIEIIKPGVRITSENLKKLDKILP